MLDDNQIFLLSSYLRVRKSYLELSQQSSGKEWYKNDSNPVALL